MIARPRMQPLGAGLNARYGQPLGFTLLELLVVMGLVALLAGLVGPVALRGLEAARLRGVEADLEAAIAVLPTRAFRSGESLQVDGAALEAAVGGLPEGWQLRLTEPLAYGPQGMARGGRVQLRGESEQLLVDWRVQPLTGAVRRQ